MPKRSGFSLRKVEGRAKLLNRKTRKSLPPANFDQPPAVSSNLRRENQQIRKMLEQMKPTAVEPRIISSKIEANAAETRPAIVVAAVASAIHRRILHARHQLQFVAVNVVVQPRVNGVVFFTLAAIG